jgi:hypothetical protein
MGKNERVNENMYTYIKWHQIDLFLFYLFILSYFICLQFRSTEHRKANIVKCFDFVKDVF